MTWQQNAGPLADLANIGFGIADRLSGGSDTAANDARFMNDFAWKQSLRNEEFQKQLATQGIRMRVADAEAAGIHPLAALGVNPSGGGNFASAFTQPIPRDKPQWQGLGQDISRAVHAMTTPEEKQYKMLQLEKMKTENEILNTELTERRANIQRSHSAGLPSNSGLSGGLVANGQGDAYVMEQPLRSTHRQPGAPHQDVGHIADMAYTRTPTGGLAIVPSKDVKERIEDQIIPEFAWAARNYGAANLNMYPKPNKKYYPLPSGYDEWRWHHGYQEFRPAQKGKSFDYVPWWMRD